MTTPAFDILETPLGNRQLLIEASAGTGKTYALTGLVVRLVLEGTELRQILVVTFTNAATDELKTRIRSRLRDVLAAFRDPATASADARHYVTRYGGDASARAACIERLEAALLDVDEASVFTIHGFCKRVLEQSAFESGAPFDAEFTEDASDQLDRAIADFWHRHTFDDPWVAALTVTSSENELRSHYRLAHRYPDTRIEPVAVPLEEAIEHLKEEVSQLVEVWNERKLDAKEALEETAWKKSSRFHDPADLEETFSGLDEHLATAPYDCADWIDLLSIDTILEGAGKRSKVEKARREELAQEPLFQACRSVSAAFRDARHSLIHRFIEGVHERFGELKRASGMLTFDDLLNRLYAALRPESAGRERLLDTIRKRWSHALIDEFQDTDPIQYEIFRTAFVGRPLVFVGDPKQAIYSFRGADLYAYLRAKEDTEREADAGEPARYKLEKNWRSADRLVRAVNELFSMPETPFVIDGVPYERISAAGEADSRALEGDGLTPLVWWAIPSADDGKPATKGQAEPDVIHGLVCGIRQLLTSGATIGGKPVSPENLAVLVRKNDEGQAVLDALNDAGIPAVVSKGGDIWSSPEVADLEHLLRAILRATERTALCNALATDLWGKDANAIHELQQDEVRLEETRLALHEYQQLWRRHGVLRALMQFIEDHDVTERLLKLQDGERRLTNVRHALELLHEEESRRSRGPEELVQWLRARESRRVDDSETAELRLETDEAAVQIVTVHKSKGLQYDIVFAPFLWSGRTKYKTGVPVLIHEDDEVVYDFGSERAEPRQRIADAERLSEDLRLAYVAMTRAVHRCYVAWGAVNQSECSALAYLLHGHMAGGESMVAHVQQAFALAKKELPTTRLSLDAFAAACPDLMTVVELPSEAPPVAVPPADDVALRPRQLSDAALRRLKPWSITSFSQLTRG
ncbi:MAG: UvrD-helicase domain-containing protein, partial [Bacteroidota bacterium]